MGVRYLVKVGGNTRGWQVAHIEGWKGLPLCGQRIAREQWQICLESQVTISICRNCQIQARPKYEIAVEKFRQRRRSVR